MLRSIIIEGATAEAAFTQLNTTSTFTLFPTIHNQYTIDNAWRLQEMFDFFSQSKSDTFLGAQIYYAFREIDRDGVLLGEIAFALMDGGIACFPEVNEGFYTFVWKVSESS